MAAPKGYTTDRLVCGDCRGMPDAFTIDITDMYRQIDFEVTHHEKGDHTIKVTVRPPYADTMLAARKADPDS